ncbi:hypothetical protein CABS01_01451 [Colletotrichum abscissum]|uniref:Uncharacterized protein n=1 Tax=Colletotrichum abscissum TaxID=1671311 RepID=A0A9P9X858_9PEZI|nr:uncharacterized protein CABS01_01451 [Colletotrichum abscissum]KAI3541170.1 hypothetical protein CABS02_10846 [Colletotrichum abscissum]KAK1495644.1 hypothetical protein CABS01_01451 [Colletotrichum abscissum]
MADFSWTKPLPPRRRRSELTLSNPPPDEEESVAHLGVPSVRSRQWKPIPRIASLDVLSAARLGTSNSPSIKSDGSQSSCHRLSPSPAEPTEPADTAWYQERDETERALSLEQMINALHYTMMTKNVLDPVPREYNSYILHLLEGYWDLQERLRKTEQELAEEKETKLKSLEEFTKMSEEWESKEADFRAEIKRMELVLVDVTPAGVGAVVLARSGSLVDRSAKSSRLFKARVEKAKESPQKGDDSTSKVDSLDNPRISMGSGTPLLNHRTFLSMKPKVDDNADVELSKGLRKAERRQQRASRRRKKEALFPSFNIAWDSSSEEEANKSTSIQKTTRLPGLESMKPQPLRRAAPSAQIATPESSAKKTAVPGTCEHADTHYRPDDAPHTGVELAENGSAATGMPKQERPPGTDPDVMTATTGRRTSGTRRHMRDFSFDAVEDSVQLQALSGKAGIPYGNDVSVGRPAAFPPQRPRSSDKVAPMASFTAGPSNQQDQTLHSHAQESLDKDEGNTLETRSGVEQIGAEGGRQATRPSLLDRRRSSRSHKSSCESLGNG